MYTLYLARTLLALYTRLFLDIFLEKRWVSYSNTSFIEECYNFENVYLL